MCEHCGTLEDVEECECMTAFHEQQANTNPVLCPGCARNYFEYWEDQWAIYNAGRMC
jgi:hypothetical protein